MDLMNLHTFFFFQDTTQDKAAEIEKLQVLTMEMRRHSQEIRNDWYWSTKIYKCDLSCSEQVWFYACQTQEKYSPELHYA